MANMPMPALIEFNGNAISDHNRTELDVSPEAIERKVRTAKGHMRKYHVAYKRTFSTSWDMLPGATAKTVDGKWGADAIEAFYYATPGQFQLNVTNRDGTKQTYNVMFSDFSKALSKRWEGDNYYSVSVSMEEV